MFDVGYWGSWKLEDIFNIKYEDHIGPITSVRINSAGVNP